LLAPTHASRAGEVERNQSNLVAHFRAYRPLSVLVSEE
jgi:hypothetical protein